MSKIYIIILCLLFFACGDHDSQNETLPELLVRLDRPLPENPPVLKILAIGNSFTDDAMAYLPDLLSAKGITNVTLGKLSYPACSLADHWYFYTKNRSLYNYQKSVSNKWVTVRSSCTLEEGILNEPWDIIVLQQVSQESGMYSRYQPHLINLINAIYSDCSNKNVLFGWHMTWAYSRKSTHNGFINYNNNQGYMYQQITGAVKAMVEDTKLTLIIPSGSAIQNLRNTSVNNPPLDLTRDGSHIDLGAGRYTLAYTWYETLIVPCIKPTVENNTLRIKAGNVPVNDSNYQICLDAVKKACNNKFAVTY